MFKLRWSTIWLISLLIWLNLDAAAAPPLIAGGLSVTGIEPLPRSLVNPVSTAVTIQFDKPINRNTITTDTFWAFGRWSGTAAGNYSFANGDQTVILTPDRPFSAGEQVMVILGNQIQASDGSPLRSAGYSFQFWTTAGPGNLIFEDIETLSTRTTPNEPSRAYGGTATDMNNDGWLDLTIINEDTADVRVFLNRADGSGRYHDFIQPPSPVNNRASPNEPSDFNRDGNADLAVANIDTNSVSILLGNGDGTFAPQQEITVGSQPRGITVLDVDGDGDTDIINTNSGSGGNLSLLLNDGSGTFGLPTFFEGGGSFEWALAAADLNEDQILDLVVGSRSSPDATIITHLGNGDGTFVFQMSQSAGGAVWMLNSGDVNGDGHEDVATANSFDNNGAILLGDGAGNLAPPVTTPTDPFPLATDLGDIDGDGDLDWVTSSFNGDWFLFLNDGQGNFTFNQAFAAPAAASCALMLDIDNDGGLDLALIDELADVVIIKANSETRLWLPMFRNE